MANLFVRFYYYCKKVDSETANIHATKIYSNCAIQDIKTSNEDERMGQLIRSTEEEDARTDLRQEEVSSNTPTENRIFFCYKLSAVEKFNMALMLVSAVLFVINLSLVLSSPRHAIPAGETFTVETYNQNSCEPCEKFEQKFRALHLTTGEYTSALNAMTRMDDGVTCCVSRMSELISAMARSLENSLDSALDGRQRAHSRKRFVGIRVAPSVFHDLQDDNEIVEITDWTFGDDTSFNIRFDQKPRWFQIPTDAVYAVRVRMSWAPTSHEDGDLEEFRIEVSKLPRHGRRTILLVDAERKRCDPSLHTRSRPCVSMTLTATLTLSEDDVINVGVTHPSKLITNHKFSYFEIIRAS